MTDRLNCSGCKIVKVNFTWYDVQVPFLQTTDGNGKTIESPFFSSKETPHSQWKLLLADRGTNMVINAYHFFKSKINQVDPELLKVSIIKGSENPFRHKRILAFHPAGCEIPKSEVLLHSNGSLQFLVTILVLAPKKEIVSSNNAINCSNGLSTQLEGLFDSMQFSDVIFNVGGRELPAHKNILIARGKPFAAMFEHPTKEKLTNQIEIEDIEPDVFHELLRFIYTGRLSTATMESMAVGLLIAADKYLLDDLKKECENYMLRKMTPLNCLDLLFKDNVPSSLEQLQQIASYFLRGNKKIVMATDKWKELKKENNPLLSDFI